MYFTILGAMLLTLYSFIGTLQALPVDGNPLQMMVSEIQPSFTEGLTHLENLFDIVLNYDEYDYYYTTNESIVFAMIQTAIRRTFDSMSDSEQLTQKHLKKYEAKVFALAQDIDDKEKRITKMKVALGSFEIKRYERQREIESIRSEVSHINAKIRESQYRVQLARDEISRGERDRIGWIVGTILTLGLVWPGLFINEIDLQNAERNRDAHQSNAEERRQTLRSVENDLRDISRRQSITEMSIRGTEASLTSVRLVLDELKIQDQFLRGFEALRLI